MFASVFPFSTRSWRIDCGFGVSGFRGWGLGGTRNTLYKRSDICVRKRGACRFTHKEIQIQVVDSAKWVIICYLLVPAFSRTRMNQTNSLSKGPFCQKLPLSISILSSPDTHRACAISQGQTSSPVTATHGLDHPIKAKKYLVYCLYCGVLCCEMFLCASKLIHFTGSKSAENQLLQGTRPVVEPTAPHISTLSLALH